MHLTALERLRPFVLHGTETLGEKIAHALGCSLAALEERSFEDGEHKIRPLETVAGRDVYVVHSLHGGPDESPNDKLCKLLFFIAALKDAGAARVTAVTPYLRGKIAVRRLMTPLPSVTSRLCLRRWASTPSSRSRFTMNLLLKTRFDALRSR
jgi:hypothetical protein